MYMISFKGHPQEDASSRSSGGVAVHDIQRHRGSVSQDLGLDFVQDHLGLSSISHRATSKWMVSLWLPLKSSPIRHRAPKKNMFSPKNPSLRARKLVVKGQPQKGTLHLCTFAPLRLKNRRPSNQTLGAVENMAHPQRRPELASSRGSFGHPSAPVKGLAT